MRSDRNELFFLIIVFVSMLPLIVYVPRRLFGHYDGFSWFIFIWIMRSVKNRARVINHEKIHFRQQVEMLFIPHWILYGWYYFHLRLKGFDHHQAYLNNPFEREAYENDGNPRYLVTRPAFAWIGYVKSLQGGRYQK